MKTRPLTLSDWAKGIKPDTKAMVQILAETNAIMDDMKGLGAKWRKPSSRNYMLESLTRIVGKAKARQVLKALRKPTRAMISAGFYNADEQDARGTWVAMVDKVLK